MGSLVLFLKANKSMKKGMACNSGDIDRTFKPEAWPCLANGSILEVRC